MGERRQIEVPSYWPMAARKVKRTHAVMQGEHSAK